jgi:alpha-galactosidase
MTICVKTLYDVFPQIKAFGCCHEVFHAQKFLCLVLEKIKNIKIDRTDIYTDASGINHFTWITEANYKDIDILSLIPEFMDRYYDEGYYEYQNRFQWKYDYFAYGNKVKMDMYRRYKALGAAGDRHLVEFMDHDMYLKNPSTVEEYCFRLTPVSWRVQNQQNKIKEAMMLAEGKEEFILGPSGEEAVDLMKAILGLERIVSNVNMPNMGQVPGLPIGSIVESNCLFSAGSAKPIIANRLPDEVLKLVKLNSDNIDLCYKGIKERNLDYIFEAFKNQPLCSKLNYNDAKALFKKMVLNTKKYLDEFYNLDEYLNR